MKARVYVTAKTAESFEGRNEADIKRKALALFRKDVLEGNLSAWVKVELVVQGSTPLKS